MSYELRDGLEFLKSLPDKSVDGIFTDPPWGKGPDIIGQDVWLDLLRGLDEQGSRVLRGGGVVWFGLA